MAWTAPRTWVTSEVVTAAIMNTHVRDNFLETAPAVITGGSQIIVGTAANAITTRTVNSAVESTSETTTSTSYTDLATSGPSITATTGSSAVVLVQAHMSNNTAGEECFTSVDITGATTQAPSDAWAVTITSNAANDAYLVGGHVRFGSLTGGSNTFKLEYKVSAGTGTFNHRRITVIPI